MADSRGLHVMSADARAGIGRPILICAGVALIIVFVLEIAQSIAHTLPVQGTAYSNFSE